MSDSPSESHFQERWRDTVHRRVAGRAAGADLVDDARALSEAAAIVRDLAALDWSPSTESGNCRFCGTEFLDDLPAHDPACAWRKAVEWAERNGHG